MKLLYITNGITASGGLERVLSIKASKLAQDFGYEVHILSLNENRKSPFFTFSPKIIHHHINVSGNLIHYIKQYKKGIHDAVAKINPDVISVCDDGLKGFFIPKILKTQIPVIYERHASVNIGKTQSSVANFKNDLQHRMMKFLAKDFSQFVVLTTGNLKEWNAGNIKVIPNPVSFYPETSSSLDNKTVIAVGSHSYNKGYDLLLQAWKEIGAGFSDWELEIYGKSKDDTYQTIAKENGLKNVKFYPPTADIEKKYMESSVLVLPSRSEGFGMVIIEAMSCGVPAVSFDCPHGPGDIITEGKDGFLVEKGNVKQLAEKLSEVMANEAMRKKMGSAAKENVKVYLPENIVKQWDDLFKELINGTAR